jgi:cytochrome c oxidase subunit III
VKEGHEYRIAVWIVIASEALLFAGLFTLYTAYRSEHLAAFTTAAGKDISWIGGTNTMVLLTSSFFMAVAVKLRQARWASLVVLLLGGCFLVLKAIEWGIHIHDGIVPGSGPRGESLFFSLYYLMTGLHALHVIAGIALVAWARRRSHTATELVALYWHFVDLIWVFLWPLFYLVK